MFKFNSHHGESQTASMHDLMVQEPMAPEIYAQIQAQRRKARQQIEAAKDQRFYRDRNHTYD